MASTVRVELKRGLIDHTGKIQTDVMYDYTVIGPVARILFVYFVLRHVKEND